MVHCARNKNDLKNRIFSAELPQKANMMPSPSYEILVCPATQQALSMAEPELVDRVNSAIKAQKLRNKAGDLVQTLVDQLLIREDRTLAYAVIDSIPHMITEHAILLEEVPRSR